MAQHKNIKIDENGRNLLFGILKNDEGQFTEVTESSSCAESALES
jgi:hypothetical protein